jgi:hypothetical protein
MVWLVAQALWPPNSAAAKKIQTTAVAKQYGNLIITLTPTI